MSGFDCETSLGLDRVREMETPIARFVAPHLPPAPAREQDHTRPDFENPDGRVLSSHPRLRWTGAEGCSSGKLPSRLEIESCRRETAIDIDKSLT
jgi:hypothetical protein